MYDIETIKDLIEMRRYNIVRVECDFIFYWYYDEKLWFCMECNDFPIGPFEADEFKDTLELAKLELERVCKEILESGGRLPRPTRAVAKEGFYDKSFVHEITVFVFVEKDVECYREGVFMEREDTRWDVERAVW